MKHALIAVLVLLGLAAPCHSEQADFTTDKPSPLQLIEPERVHVVSQFSGSVQLSGRFLVTWAAVDKETRHLQITFYPDAESAALLPRMARDRPVKELYFSNREDAAAMLLDVPTAQAIHAKELLTAKGEAIVTIRAYTVEVACDQRWYSAELVSTDRSRHIVVGAHERGRVGCG